MTFTLLLTTGLFSAALASVPDGLGTPLEDSRQALQDWVQTRQLISQEKHEWVQGRELLKGRVDLVQREIQTIQERTQEAQDSMDGASKQREELVLENETLKVSSEAFLTDVKRLEARMRGLLGRLPQPLVERVSSLSQRIPAEGAETKLGLSDRYLNIVGILNEVDRFHREVTLTSEVHELPGGKTAEVAVMYVGLGQAYYVTNGGDHAGIGTASSEGWVWTPADKFAKEISKAIAILKNEEIAQFVCLPVHFDLSGESE